MYFPLAPPLVSSRTPNLVVNLQKAFCHAFLFGFRFVLFFKCTVSLLLLCRWCEHISKGRVGGTGGVS